MNKYDIYCIVCSELHANCTCEPEELDWLEDDNDDRYEDDTYGLPWYDIDEDLQSRD